MEQTNSDPLTASKKWRGMNSKERFKTKYLIDESGCWLWRAALNNDGYGKFSVARKHWAAHRYSYVAAFGPIPQGLTLDHKCRIRHCVNPDHLEAVTMRENLMRGNTLQALNAAKTHCKRGHEFTVNNTDYDSGGWRQCRECRLDYSEKRRRASGAKPKKRYNTVRSRQGVQQ